MSEQLLSPIIFAIKDLIKYFNYFVSNFFTYVASSRVISLGLFRDNNPLHYPLQKQCTVYMYIYIYKYIVYIYNCHMWIFFFAS